MLLWTKLFLKNPWLPRAKSLIWEDWFTVRQSSLVIALWLTCVLCGAELIEKQEVQDTGDFFLFKILRAHILPLTNCAFNKSGDKFITGSYDRTCKVWNTITGDELLTLEGHRNVVYAIAFNNPYGDKIITGSFGSFLIVLLVLRITVIPSPAR